MDVDDGGDGNGRIGEDYQLMERRRGSNDGEGEGEEEDEGDNGKRSSNYDVNISSGRSSKVFNKKYFLIFLFAFLCLAIGIVAAILYSRRSGGNELPVNSPLWTSLRLDQSIVPRSYDLKLAVNMDNDTYSGSVAIQLSVVKRTQLIMFNKVELEVTSMLVVRNRSAQSNGLMDGEGEVEVVEEAYYSTNEVYVLRVAKVSTVRGHTKRRHSENSPFSTPFPMSQFLSLFCFDGKNELNFPIRMTT